MVRATIERAGHHRTSARLAMNPPAIGPQVAQGGARETVTGVLGISSNNATISNWTVLAERHGIVATTDGKGLPPEERNTSQGSMIIDEQPGARTRTPPIVRTEPVSRLAANDSNTTTTANNRLLKVKR